MSKIAVDIDDTLYSFSDAAREVAFKRGQHELAYAHWGDWRTPPDIVGIKEWLSIIDEVHETDAILAYEPYKDSVAVVNEIAQEHEIAFMTTRNPSTAEATAEWLDINGFPTAPLFADLSDKQEKLTRFKFDALIDDRPKTLVQFCYTPADRARFGFALMKPYNHNLTDVPSIFIAPTWYGIREGLVKKGFLS